MILKTSPTDEKYSVSCFEFEIYDVVVGPETNR